MILLTHGWTIYTSFFSNNTRIYFPDSSQNGHMCNLFTDICHTTVYYPNCQLPKHTQAFSLWTCVCGKPWNMLCKVMCPATWHVCQQNVAEDQDIIADELSPSSPQDPSLSAFLSVPRSKQIKCLKRCIEVSLRVLYDGYVMWHNASERPSQIKWQMLFFASWIPLGQADFESSF